MKKFLAVILSLTLVFLSLTACASKSYVDLDQLNKEYQSDDSEQTNSENNDKVVGDKYTIPEEENPYYLSEYGFYTLEKTGDMLIEITGYDLTSDTPYVYYEGSSGPSIHSWKNGFEYFYNLPKLTESKQVFNKNDITVRTIGDPYMIVDNDNVYFGSDSDTIVERKVFEGQNLVILGIPGGLGYPLYYVPSSKIDLDKGILVELIEDVYPYTYRYTFYLMR